MLLTRIWGVILACLATFFLGGMFLVASSGDEDFTDADSEAIRAVTEAGTAALEAQLVGHPVQQTPSVLYNDRVQERLAKGDDAVAAGQLTLGELVAELTEGLRVRHSNASLTVALLDGGGTIKASNGASEPILPELLGSAAVAEIKADTEALFSIVLGGNLFVAKISKADGTGNRLVGLGELDVGAGSTFRRVLGSATPAALVRKGKLVGEIIGDQPVSAQLEALAKSHVSDAPASGASKVFRIGEGMEARLGALGRIPGPAGRGDDGLVLAVLTGKTAAAGKQDLATALRRAREGSRLTSVNFAMLLGLLVVTAALSIYLPTLEGTGPLDRLRREFDAMAQGTQHNLFHDRYGGPFGSLARSANAAHEALRQAYLAELEIEEEGFEANPTAPRARPGSGRLRRPTRAHRRAGVDTGRRTAGRSGPNPKRLRSSKNNDVIAAASKAAPVKPEASAPPATPPSFGLQATDPAGAAVSPPTPATPFAPAAPPSTPQAKAPAPGRPAPELPPPATPPSPPATAPRGAGTPRPSRLPSNRPVAAESSSGPAAAGSGSHPRKPPGPPPMPAPEPSLALQIDELAQAFPAVEPAAPPPARPSAADEAYRGVYEEFLQVKQACGESTANFTYDKFAKKLAKQTAAIKAKRAGVADVRFTVYVKDGKAALRAKVIKA